jgi:hypothetical protein
MKTESLILNKKHSLAVGNSNIKNNIIDSDGED